MKRSVSPYPKSGNEHVTKGQNPSSDPLQASIERPISPPPLKRKRTAPQTQSTSLGTSVPQTPQIAAVEAGEVSIDDHLLFFSSKLQEHIYPASSIPFSHRITHSEWIDLYKRNQHPDGRHFVIHQHDHPVAGTHYDLRLQISETSSISWAIMYGLPGDANSRRLNRNATETRVHCLWNHLIETASHTTGSMLIWDTGEYSIVEKQELHSEPQSSESELDSDQDAAGKTKVRSETEKLHQAFKNHKIRLRLHGTRLPPGYTIYIRLTHEKNTTNQPKKPTSRRRRKGHPPKQESHDSSASSDEEEGADSPNTSNTISASNSDDEDAAIRKNNAYLGAINSVGSIHQRKWYLSIDRLNSGFVPVRDAQTKKIRWARKKDGDGEEAEGFEPFYVRGRDVERSVVTGRLGRDILDDEGVVGYVSRKLWRAVLE